MFAIFFILLLHCRIHSQEEVHSNPFMVHILFRHGDRTPLAISIYPKDPYKNETYSPVGMGELTLKGREQMFGLGKFIRKMYSKLFGDNYMPETLRAYSSDTNRTKMSLQLVLAGLFPPRHVEVQHEDLAWHPIPFETLKRSEDKIFFGISCPNYPKLYLKYSESEEVTAVKRKNNPLFQYLSENTGSNITSFLSASGLYFCLLSELQWGLKLPEWTRNVFPEQLERMTVKQYEIYGGTTEMLKLASGYLLQKIVDDTRQKINGTLPKERTAFLYSGHELNIASLLHTFNVFDSHISACGSAVFIELHRIEEKFGIKVFYSNNAQELKPLALPGCGLFCPWEKFENLVEKYLPSESSCGGPLWDTRKYLSK